MISNFVRDEGFQRLPHRQHILDAGSGSLMIFDPIIPLFPIKVNDKQQEIHKRRSFGGAINMAGLSLRRQPLTEKHYRRIR